MADADVGPLLADYPLEERPLLQKEPPPWFSPQRLLALFCAISLLVYIDRGALSSNGVNGSPRTAVNPAGEGIQGDFDLTYFQDGLLPAAFMVGLLIASAAFAEATKFYNAMRLIGVGLAIWTASVVVCAGAPNFAVLISARSLMGAGEASFLALAAPFIDDVAPPKTKTLWFATFYMTNTAGYALGYIIGGILGPAVGWRGVFLFEALLMMPFVGFTLLAQPVDLRSLKTHKEGDPVQSTGTSGGVWRLLYGAIAHFAHLCKFPVFLLNTCGGVMWTANVGALAFWGPKAARQLFDLGPEWVDLLFGALTAASSICGTLGGAAVSDLLGSSLRRSMVVSGVVTLLAFGLFEIAFLSSTIISFPAFMALLGTGMLFLFAASGPSNAVNMWSVPVDLRPQAVSLSTILGHLLGDVPSPPALGWMQDSVIHHWDLTMAVCSLLLLLSGASYLAGSALACPAADHRVTEPNPEHPEEAEQHLHDDERETNA